MNIFIDLLIQTIVSFAATFTFSMIFNVPRKELIFCGITGSAGWIVYKITLLIIPGSIVTGTFLGSIVLTSLSRILSYKRRMPVLAYLIGGIIPLVPGAGIYYTLYELIINNDSAASFTQGLESAKIAGSISIGIMCILSLPRILFTFNLKGKK